MLAHEIPKVGQDVAVPAAAELCLQPPLRGKQAKLVEPGGNRLHARLLVEVRQRRAEPEVQGCREGRRGLLEASLLER
jgi:hypothetical protein